MENRHRGSDKIGHEEMDELLKECLLAEEGGLNDKVVEMSGEVVFSSDFDIEPSGQREGEFMKAVEGDRKNGYGRIGTLITLGILIIGVIAYLFSSTSVEDGSDRTTDTEGELQAIGTLKDSERRTADQLSVDLAEGRVVVPDKEVVSPRSVDQEPGETYGKGGIDKGTDTHPSFKNEDTRAIKVDDIVATNGRVAQQSTESNERSQVISLSDMGGINESPGIGDQPETRGVVIEFRKLDAQDLLRYAGTYYCDESGSIIALAYKEGRLKVKEKGQRPQWIERVGQQGSTAYSSNPHSTFLDFIFDESRNVIGFEMKRETVQIHKYRKL